MYGYREPNRCTRSWSILEYEYNIMFSLVESNNEMFGLRKQLTMTFVRGKTSCQI